MKDRNETPKQKEARLSAFERDERSTRKTKTKTSNNWKLNRVDDIAWKQDDSGIYVLIYWDIETDTVRIDFMSDSDNPLISFQGDADNVRKHCMRWIDSRLSQKMDIRVSAEHAAYIGSELEKADTMRIDYVQDGPKTSAMLTAMRKSDSELMQEFFVHNKKKAKSITAKDYRSYLQSIERRNSIVR